MNFFKLLYKEPGSFEVRLKRGSYVIECWGASGGPEVEGGRGGFVSGLIHLESDETLFLFVGEQGSKNNNSVTFNGGGGSALFSPSGDNTQSYAYSGGGSTDVRLFGGSWNSFNGLKSRIIVAGGGGGGSNFIYNSISSPARGGNSGGLIGNNGTFSHCSGCLFYAHDISTGGTQVEGGSPGGGGDFTYGNIGTYGKGGSANTSPGYWPSGGGGGGYFGGGSGGVSSNNLGTGAGGSSYISGCSGCISISNDSSSENDISFIGNTHYSGFSFQDIYSKDGDSSFESPSGDTEQGHLGDGAIIISFIGMKCEIKSLFLCFYHSSFCLFFLQSFFSQ